MATNRASALDIEKKPSLVQQESASTGTGLDSVSDYGKHGVAATSRAPGLSDINEVCCPTFMYVVLS
jgi:hypothetical protein